MKIRAWYIVGVILIGIAIWMALKPDNWMNWLGFSNYAYFKSGVVYAFLSGLGPCLVGLLGAGTIIVTLLRHLNCHVDGCPGIIRHKVANGEYGVCGRHWREMNGHPADHKFTLDHIRDHHHAHLKATGRA